MSETATWVGVLWVLGGYLVGTLPSTYLIARARHGTELMAAAHRDAGEADAHILMTKYMGGGWSGLAATIDVLKGLVLLLVAREAGNLSTTWLALTGVAVVIGHGWPPYARAMAGRGLAGAAGVYLALLPIPMVVMGVLIVLGAMAGATSAASTLGLASVPFVAAIQGQPVAFVAMAGALLAVILLRRLEGVGEVVRSGIPRWRAAWYRLVYDSSGPPHSRRAAEQDRVPPESAS